MEDDVAAEGNHASRISQLKVNIDNKARFAILMVILAVLLPLNMVGCR
jgi:hypothetical protein